MLAKVTAKNQLTLPKAAIAAVGSATYFDVQTHSCAIVLTPVRIQGSDALRAKLAELKLTQKDLDAAVDWARRRVAEPSASYATKRPAKPRKSTKSKP